MNRTASQAAWQFRDKGTAALLALGMVTAASLTALAYWPGLMTWDAIRQYGQAIDGDFDDWHPPAMEWLWRQLIPIHTGPAPMLILQLALYWGGFALLAGWALRERRRGLAAALAACGLLPIAMALMGAVLKDCLMAGALITTTGLLFWSDDSTRWRWLLRGLGIALLLFAAMLRFNAFLAALPLFVALLPVAWRSSWLRMTVSAIVATMLLMLALPLANRAIGAESSGVELSLIIFDLGGITEHSGVNVFPPMGVADPVAANHACYSPVKWDPYSFWVDPVCPLGFDPMKAAVKAQGIKPYRFWAGAILAHPIAYAEHRLAHFNINTRFLIHDQVERPIQVVSAPNDWNYKVTPNPILSAIDWAARASARTPLGWPIAWIALAFGILVLSPTLPSRRLIVPLALSALLYGLGYGVFSVAAELRYHLWTMIAALIAAVLTMGDLVGMPGVPWRRIGWAGAPLMVVLLLATAWRALPIG
jgi:MFS family permease